MKKPQIIPVNIAVFVVTTLIAVVGVPMWIAFNGVDLVEISIAVFLFFFTGMSITAGYHRLWSHKTYDAHPAVRAVLAMVAPWPYRIVSCIGLLTTASITVM